MSLTNQISLFPALAAGISTILFLQPISAMEPPRPNPDKAKADLPEMVIVSDHEPAAVIVVGKDASEQVQTAAGTLQSYIEASTGATLPIIHESDGSPSIHVGSTPADGQLETDIVGLDEDGFVLESVDADNFVILGGGDWGTEFGVYDFLERFVGVRRLMPGEDGEVVPRHTTLAIPWTRLREEPVYFVSRTFSGARTSREEGVEWARFNRMRFHRLRYRHNLNRLFPVSQFGESNPEFYPVLDGERFIPPNDNNHAWQPNFSAPGIVDAAVRRIDQYFQEHPEATSYSLSTNDTGNFDESPESLARRTGKTNRLNFEDVSNDYFPWANEVVEQVLKKHPNKWFGTYAYRETLEPPDNLARLNPRLVPLITYERLRWSDPVLRAADQRLTKRWAQVAPTLGWYDYTYGLAYQIPRVWFHLMQDYLSWGADHNVRSFHGDYIPNWSGEGPKAWVLNKLLWNPYQDVEPLLDDWCRNAVGPRAAPKLREYYSIWETFWTEDILNSAWNRGEGEDAGLYLPFQNPGYLMDVPESYVRRADALMDEVLELADTPARKRRAERMRRMWHFYRASIIVFQAETAAASAILENEQQVLSLLDEAEAVLDESAKRTALVQSFDGHDGAFTPYFYMRPLLIGTNWGNSLIWRARPWINRSAKVRQRVESLAENENPKIRELAQNVLLAADGHATPVSENPSFESDMESWRHSVHRLSEGAFHTSARAAKTGARGLLGQGIGRGRVSQAVPYEAGSYYITASCYVPDDYQKGKVIVRFWVSGKWWQDRGFSKYAMALPAQEIPLQPGQWTTLELPFTLPPSREIEVFHLNVDVTEFPENGSVFIDDVELYRIEE